MLREMIGKANGRLADTLRRPLARTRPRSNLGPDWTPMPQSPRDNRHDFLAAYDALHREMTLKLKAPELSFGECVVRMRDSGLGSADARFLHDVRELRNFHAHANDLAQRRLMTVTYEPALIARLVTIAGKIADKTSARLFMIPWSQVLATTIDAPARALAAKMLASNYSHAPVIDGKRMIATYDERAVFRALAEGRLAGVGDRTTVGDVVCACRFDEIAPEEVGVDFVPRDIALPELRRQLDEHTRARDRITLAIVTEHGRPTETPLGLLTIWDIPQVD